MLYHKLHWGATERGQNFYWGEVAASPPWSPFEPPLVTFAPFLSFGQGTMELTVSSFHIVLCTEVISVHIHKHISTLKWAVLTVLWIGFVTLGLFHCAYRKVHGFYVQFISL